MFDVSVVSLTNQFSLTLPLRNTNTKLGKNCDTPGCPLDDVDSINIHSRASCVHYFQMQDPTHLCPSLTLLND